MRAAPSRADLLVVVARLQEYLSTAAGLVDDESQDRKRKLRATIDRGFSLCVAALEQDGITDVTRGHWAENPTGRAPTKETK